MTAGALAQFIASPADLLKVHIQMEGKRRLMGEPPRVKGLVDAFVKVFKSSGIRGLWKGNASVQIFIGILFTIANKKRFSFFFFWVF